MSTAPSTIFFIVFECRHIYTNGHRCGSPCLRQQDLCYYHHTSRIRQAPPTQDLSQGDHRSAAFALPTPEDRSAIQAAIGEILNRLASNELDPRRAGLLLYGLQIASINLPRVAPAAASPETVVDVVIHPDLGTLAEPTELQRTTDPASSTLIGQLLQQLQRSAAPIADPCQAGEP